MVFWPIGHFRTKDFAPQSAEDPKALEERVQKGSGWICSTMLNHRFREVVSALSGELSNIRVGTDNLHLKNPWIGSVHLTHKPFSHQPCLCSPCLSNTLTYPTFPKSKQKCLRSLSQIFANLKVPTQMQVLYMVNIKP